MWEGTDNLANNKDPHPILIERTSHDPDVMGFKLDALIVQDICKVSLWERANTFYVKRTAHGYLRRQFSCAPISVPPCMTL